MWLNIKTVVPGLTGHHKLYGGRDLFARLFNFLLKRRTCGSLSMMLSLAWGILCFSTSTALAAGPTVTIVAPSQESGSL